MKYEKTVEKRPCGILWNLLPTSKKHDVTSLNSEHWSVLSTLKSIHWPSWTMNCHEHYLFKLPQNSVAGWFAPIPIYPYVSQQYTSHFSHLNQSSQAWLETITWKLETSQAKDVEISPKAAPENRGIGQAPPRWERTTGPRWTSAAPLCGASSPPGCPSWRKRRAYLDGNWAAPLWGFEHI